jgi:phosphate transport system substrate-binding protein
MMGRSEFHVTSARPRATILILMACVASCQVHGVSWAGEESAPIVIRGSSTLQPFVEMWAEAFSRTEQSIQFDISSTGTSEGIADLLAGRADISMASRPLSQEEKSAARDKGLSIRGTTVARMGIAVIVHRENPVSSIEVEKLAEIFSGEVRSWQVVGGPDETIVVVRKDSGWSPDFFRRRVMGDREFVRESVMVDSKEGVVEEVASRPWSIGVTGMPEAIPALDRIHLVRLDSGDSQRYSTYALSRPLFFFITEETPSVRRFIRYVLLDQSQDMILDTGFYPASQSDAMSTE